MLTRMINTLVTAINGVPLDRLPLAYAATGTFCLAAIAALLGALPVWSPPAIALAVLGLGKLAEK